MKEYVGRVLILVENLSVPFDRRVWLEATTLRKAGYQVAVICPSSKFDPEPYAEIDGIHIYRYNLPLTGSGIWDHIREYAIAMTKTMFLTLKVFFKGGFEVIHACNPPDLFFIIGPFYKILGKKFVFDQHDLSPETYMVQSGGKRGILYRILLLLERLTYKISDLVIATNQSVKQIAINRGKLPPSKVVIVRTGPDLNRFHPVEPAPELKKGKKYLVAYLGVMGPQDGVDYALKAAHYLVKIRKRNDVHFVFIGSGDVFEELLDLKDILGLGPETVTFTGRIPDEEVLKYLSTADVCISPDPKNGLNEFHTMNKTLEYMAMGKPQVCFDLKEMRVSAGEAALYAKPNDVKDFALKIEKLLDNQNLRNHMGNTGYLRVKNTLSWEHTSEALIEGYRSLIYSNAKPVSKACLRV